MLHIPSLYIFETENKGRGVYIGEDILAGSIVEVCPLVIFPQEDTPHINSTLAYNYYFVYPDGSDRICIALGYGSLYNHSYSPNAEVIFDLSSQEIIIQAKKNITAGDEVCIDYKGGDEKRKLWFEVQQ